MEYSLLFPPMQKLWKSIKKCKTCSRKATGLFFSWTQCIYSKSFNEKTGLLCRAVHMVIITLSVLLHFVQCRWFLALGIPFLPVFIATPSQAMIPLRCYSVKVLQDSACDALSKDKLKDSYYYLPHSNAIAWDNYKASLCLSVHVCALLQSHFLIDFSRNWHRGNNPQKWERVRCGLILHHPFPYFAPNNPHFRHKRSWKSMQT